MPVAGNELDPVARLGGCADRLADVHAERCADGGPQLGAPVLELAVEVAGGVTDAPVVQPPRTERRHPLVDEGRQLLEGVGPFPVAAAEHGVGDAGQVGLVPGQPPGELDRVIRRGSVVGGGGDGDGAVAGQGVHVVVQRGQAGAEAAARPLGGELPGDLLGGAEVGSVQDQQRGAVIGPLRGRPRDGLRGLAWCRSGESGCEHCALQGRNRRELGREVVDAVHEAGAQPGRGTAGLDVGQAREQFGEQRPGIQPREVGAEAEVGAVAEGQVRVGIAGDVEAVRVDEHGLVPVGGRVVDLYLVVLGDVLAGQFEVAGGGPAELDDRRGEPQHLFQRGRQQAQVVAEPDELTGVLRQGQQRVRQQVAGGVVARDHQQLEEPVEVVVGEPVAVDLGVDDRAPHVAGGVRPLFRGALPAVGEHLAERGHECLRIAAVFWVVQADQGVRPLEQQMPVLGAHTEHIRQHAQRHFGGDRGDEIDLAFLAHRVDDGACVTRDRVEQLAPDRLRSEGAVDDLAELGVLRGIHVQHHPAEHLDVGRSRIAQHAGTAPGGEVGGGAGDVCNVGVPQDGPEAGPTRERAGCGFVHPDDRAGAAQLGEQRVGYAVGVVIGVGEVDGRSCR